MGIKELNHHPETADNSSLNELFVQTERLLIEIRKKELPVPLVASVNQHIDELNSFSGPGEQLKKLAKKNQGKIIALLEKDLKIIPKNYYRNIWLGVGMAAFGIPLGVAFGTTIGNMAFLGIGLPIGLAIGAGVGMGMDKKAFEEGRQLDLEI